MRRSSSRVGAGVIATLGATRSGHPGVVGNVFKVVPQLSEELKRRKA